MRELATLGMCLLLGTARATLSPDASVICAQYSAVPTAVAVQPPLVLPQDIAIDGDGDIFVVDSARKELMRVDAASGNTNIILGPPYLEIPVGLSISPQHADLYIGDENSSKVFHLLCQQRDQKACTEYSQQPLEIDLGTAVHPVGLQLDAADNLFIADYNGGRVLYRSSTTATVTTLMSSSTIGSAANPFGPHDIAIDSETHAILVTDQNNDDIWTVTCAVQDPGGASCDTYSSQPSKLDLSGDKIIQPSGVAVDLQSVVYATGMDTGVIAQIKGTSSTDLLQGQDYLRKPVSLAFDSRASSKTLYVSDDQASNISGVVTGTGLYALPCMSKICAPLSPSYIPNVASGSCSNTPLGVSCSLTCNNGYASPNATSVTCTANGWDTAGILCLSTGSDATTTTAAPKDDAGVAVGVTLAVLIVVGVGIFLFIRYRQGRLVVKTGDYSTFGST